MVPSSKVLKKTRIRIELDLETEGSTTLPLYAEELRKLLLNFENIVPLKEV